MWLALRFFKLSCAAVFSKNNTDRDFEVKVNEKPYKR